MWNVRNILSTGLVALTIAGTTIATASQAEASNNFGAGVVAGAVGGALLTGALTAPAVSYGAPRVVYEGGPYAPYGRTVVIDHPACHVAWHENGLGEIYKVRACRM